MIYFQTNSHWQKIWNTNWIVICKTKHFKLIEVIKIRDNLNSLKLWNHKSEHVCNATNSTYLIFDTSKFQTSKFNQFFLLQGTCSFEASINLKQKYKRWPYNYQQWSLTVHFELNDIKDLMIWSNPSLQQIDQLYLRLLYHGRDLLRLHSSLGTPYSCPSKYLVLLLSVQ